MNGRIDAEDTPEGRLAAVVVTLIRRKGQDSWKLDYADFREALRLYIHREMLTARYEERHMHSAGNEARQRELWNQILHIESQIAKGQQELLSPGTT